jgi:hypothetical protein
MQLKGLNSRPVGSLKGEAFCIRTNRQFELFKNKTRTKFVDEFLQRTPMLLVTFLQGYLKANQSDSIRLLFRAQEKK